MLGNLRSGPVAIPNPSAMSNTPVRYFIVCLYRTVCTYVTARFFERSMLFTIDAPTFCTSLFGELLRPRRLSTSLFRLPPLPPPTNGNKTCTASGSFSSSTSEYTDSPRAEVEKRNTASGINHQVGRPWPGYSRFLLTLFNGGFIPMETVNRYGRIW